MLLTVITGLVMIYVVGGPVAGIMNAMTTFLNNMGSANAVLLGVIIGAMMCFDMGGPVNKAAYAFGVPATEMLRRERTRPRACRARWSAMYLAHVSFGWPLERVGHAFGLNRATAAAACRWACAARSVLSRAWPRTLQACLWPLPWALQRRSSGTAGWI